MRSFSNKSVLASLVAAAICVSASAAFAGGGVTPVVAVADFDGDTQADVLVQNAAGLLYVYITAPDGISFDFGNSGSPTTVPSGWSVKSVVDFNNDQRADVMVQNDTTRALYVYITAVGGISFDTGASGSPVTVPAGFSFVAAADSSGDNRADLLVENDVTGLLYIYITGLDGISFNFGNSGSPVTLPANKSVVSFADYNGDGRADVLVVDPITGQLCTYITAAGGITFASAVSPVTIPSGFSFLGAGDYTNEAPNERTDIMVKNSSTLLYIYATGSDGTSVDVGASGSPVTVPSGFEVAGIGNFDGKLGADTLVRNTSTNLLFVYIHDDVDTINNGTSGSPVTVPTGFNLPVFLSL